MRHKVLIVDDAVLVRRMVSDALAGDPQIEVVGTAANGKIALAKIPVLNPDLVVLDVEMPEMDGLTTLVEIRKLWPKLRVVMFSAITTEGASATLEALERGADDVVAKPSGGSIAASVEQVRHELGRRIRGLCQRHEHYPQQEARHGGEGALQPKPADQRPAPGDPGMRPAARPVQPTSAPGSQPRPQVGQSGSFSGSRNAVLGPIPARTGPAPKVDAVAIGVSTGGPNALAELIPRLVKDLPVPVLLVQHMPPTFTRLLAERLATKSQVAVVEGADLMEVLPGRVHIAPGGVHMVVERHGAGVRLRTNSDPPENSCRPAVDPLFRSCCAVWGDHVLTVVLTGMGEDGLRGGHLLRSRGAWVIAQDQASSVVWGMPGQVARHGVADQVLPLSKIADEINTRTRRGGVRS